MTDEIIRGFPLQWPVGWGRTSSAQREDHWAFKVSFAQARAELLHSVQVLGGTDIVLSTNVPLRRDGLPFADGENEPDARYDPGAAIYWVRKGKPLALACDKWTKVRWNVRSLGLAVDGLRAIERSGASTLLDRAFSGFRMLPAVASTTHGHWTEVLGVSIDASLVECEAAYKALARMHHTDRGGDGERIIALNRAIVEARAHHGVVRA